MHRTLDVEELSRRYGPMVLRRCRQLLRNEDEAMDACQDVFVRLLERRDRLDNRHPSSLLYTLEEVAVQVGLSVSGVRKRLRRLRHTLTEMGT